MWYAAGGGDWCVRCMRHSSLDSSARARKGAESDIRTDRARAQWRCTACCVYSYYRCQKLRGVRPA
eukprot:2950812-Prymnesium_polylepis.2